MENATIKEHFEGIIHDVKAEIQTYETCESDILTTCRKALCYLQDELADLKHFFLSYQFKNKAEEIEFFKELKPQIVCYLIHYNSVYSIEINNVNNKAMKTAAIKRLYNTDINNRRIKRTTKNAIINTAHIPAEVDKK